MLTQNYQIGVQQIDEQHKQIILLTQEFIHSAQHFTSEQKALCKKNFAVFKELITYHFGSEEQYQELIGFSERAKHKKLHKTFLDDLREFEFELIRTDYDVAVIDDFSRYLTRWWMYHIMKEDKKMAKVPK